VPRMVGSALHVGDAGYSGFTPNELRRYDVDATKWMQNCEKRWKISLNSACLN
jgi:hypothetical protein